MIASDLPAAFQTLPDNWRQRLRSWSDDDALAITEAVRGVSADRPIAPDDPFRALRLVAPEAVQVVVFGQDPYPGAGHADGLAFSAPRSSRPSLRRIFDVLEADRPGWRRPRSGRLDGWAAQGVLLLNPVLTVEVGRTNSHAECGWCALTSRIAAAIQRLPQQPTILLWGDKARTFWSEAAPGDSGLSVLHTRHPSNDFQRGFMAEGSHFAATAHRVDWWALRD